MELLPKEFIGIGEVDEFKFKQLDSNELGYLYEVTIPECNPHYEVFFKKVQDAGERIIAGNTINYIEKELYPKSNDFGHTAWTFKALSDAKDRLYQLEKIMAENVLRNNKK